MRFRFTAIAALLFLASSVACEDSGTTPPPPPDETYQPLTTRTAVLQNIQAAYNNRNTARYENILDDAFVFYLSASDVNNGLPVQWDRGIEMNTAHNLFSLTQVGDMPLVRSIEMDILYESGLTWVEDPQPLARAQGEMWYTTTAFYNFQIVVDQEGTDENLTYYPNPNSKAQFTVRNAGTDESPQWRLVEMSDLGSGTLALRKLATEQTTWGKVKALYR